MEIRKATQDDYDGVWDIFHRVIADGDTYVFHPDTPKADLAKLWFAPYMHTFVAEEGGKIVGTYSLKANQPDLGAHVANCGYMVHPDARGRGIGKRLCAHSLVTARALGFRSMQFNIVVSTNTVAVKLWESMGFRIIGTAPEAFNHQKLGYVDAYIMHQMLSS